MMSLFEEDEMKIKTAELIGPAFDWAVAESGGLKTQYRGGKAIGVLFPKAPRYIPFMPSTNWAQGGPIIEREVVSLGVEEGGWRALCWGKDGPNPELFSARGTTPLIAAMRCYVASKLGDEVDVPDELFN